MEHFVAAPALDATVASIACIGFCGGLWACAEAMQADASFAVRMNDAQDVLISAQGFTEVPLLLRPILQREVPNDDAVPPATIAPHGDDE